MDKFTNQGLQLKPVDTTNFHILRNLLPYYVYEFSHITQLGPTPDGTYPEKPHLIEPYQHSSEHFGFLIYSGDQLAGFALIHTMAENQYDVDQFYITRNFTRKSLGSLAFTESVKRHPGRWQVRVMLDNKSGKLFWQKVVDAISHGDYTQSREIEDNTDMDYFHFNSQSSA